MLSWFKKAKPPAPASTQRPAPAPAAPALLTARESVGSPGKRERVPEKIAEERIQTALKDSATRLDLRNLGLTRIPSSIGRLENLEDLWVGHNPLASLPDAIAKLKRLSGLEASATELTALPDWLPSLPTLRSINFSRCSMPNLPAWIGECGRLRDVHLAGNGLRQLPEEVGRLLQLEHLNLQDNDLERLPASLRGLPKLEWLFLQGNEKLGLPAEILGPSRKEVLEGKIRPADPGTILDYYARTREAARPLNEARILVLGRSGVGKTSVVNRLVRDRFLETRQTTGIRVEPWQIRPPGEVVNFQVWDFGGGETMHAAPQFLPTERSLYLVVLAGRQGGEDEDAEYWLQLLENSGGNAPVIVVLNKSSECPFELDYRGLRARYPTIREFVTIDCKERQGIQELKEMVSRESLQLSGLRKLFPTKWINVRDRLAGMAERGERFVEYETYTQICSNFGERDIAAQDQLAGYLHSLGIALCYRDDPRLCSSHLLSSHWVANGLCSVLNWPPLETQRGTLRLHDLARALDPTAYPRGQHQLLMDLMRRFELCFETPGDPGRYVIPQLLGKEQPALAAEFDALECLNFQYQYKIIPAALLARFIVRTRALSEPRGRWRSGVVLEFEGNRALIRADAQARKIFISVTGPREGRRRLLAVIRADFESLHAELPRLVVTELVPVPGHPRWVVPYQELSVFDRSGVTRAPRAFEGHLVEIKVPEMLAEVELKGAPRGSDDPLARRAGLPVFISYCQQDEALRAELEPQFKLLQRQGFISTWTDRRIIAGEHWGGQIDRQIETAEVVILLVSPDFTASHYCYDLELSRALERHAAGETIVLPVVIRPIDLRRLHFAHLPVVPEDQRAVSQWPDRAAAWQDVAAGLRLVLESRRAAGHF